MTVNAFKKYFRRKILVRPFVQWFFVILVLAIFINHTLAETGQGIPLLSDASVHALCPFGGVVTYTSILLPVHSSKKSTNRRFC